MAKAKLAIDVKGLHKQLKDSLAVANRAVAAGEKRAKAAKAKKGSRGQEADYMPALNRARRASKALQAAMYAMEAACCDVPAFNCDF